jgi:hypothetical protein
MEHVLLRMALRKEGLLCGSLQGGNPEEQWKEPVKMRKN